MCEVHSVVQHSLTAEWTMINYAASDMRALCVRLQMKLPNKPGAAQPVAATVTLDTFLHNFSVPKLMDKIADLEQHNLRAKIAAMSRPQNQQPGGQQKSANAVAFIQDLQLVDKLLVSFQRRASRRHALPASALSRASSEGSSVPNGMPITEVMFLCLHPVQACSLAVSRL